jgi:CheY-like chemotaxis protein
MVPDKGQHHNSPTHFEENGANIFSHFSAESGSNDPMDMDSVGKDEIRAKRATVLIAEDTPVMRYVLVQALQDMGVNVHAVENGEEALIALLEHHYALILMDCQMPKMNGLEATRAIRRLSSESKRNIPIVALTCGAPGQDRRHCIEAGMNDYFIKPVSTDQLREILAKWINS